MKNFSNNHKKVIKDCIFKAWLEKGGYHYTSYNLLFENLELIKELLTEEPSLIFDIVRLDDPDFFGRKFKVFFEIIKPNHQMFDSQLKDVSGNSIYDYYLNFEKQEAQVPSLIKSFFIQKGFSEDNQANLSILELNNKDIYFEHNKFYEYFKKMGYLDVKTFKEMYDLIFKMNMDGSWVDYFNRKTIENHNYSFHELIVFMVACKIYGVNQDTKKLLSSFKKSKIYNGFYNDYANHLEDIINKLDKLSQEDLRFVSDIKGILKVKPGFFSEFLDKINDYKKIKYPFLHNNLSLLYYVSEYKKDSEEKIDIPTWLTSLEKDWAGMRFEWVRTVEEINALSCYFNNCMRNYIKDVVNKECFLLKVYKGEKLMYTIQVLRDGLIGERAFKGDDEFRKDIDFIAKVIKDYFSTKERIKSLFVKKDFLTLSTIFLPNTIMTIWFILECISGFPYLTKIASYLFGY